LGPFTFEDSFNGDPKFFGFRGINLNADFGGGIKAEIQLHTKETYVFKKQVSDPIY
jgi:preprotein translocase subunit SecF